jgi:HEAT repeat protein
MLAKQIALKQPAAAHAVSLALSQIGLRKLITDESFELIRQLEAESDASTRWHAIYSLVRGGDSAMLFRHFDVIKDYLTDLGSPECRMFAASALGNIHNNDAATMLLTAARGETEWRVRVNLFNALARQPYYMSGVLDLAKKAILESRFRNAARVVRIVQPGAHQLRRQAAARSNHCNGHRCTIRYSLYPVARSHGHVCAA